MPSTPLSNYLRTHRQRAMLSQEEVAFLLGLKGEDKRIKVCRDERMNRRPSLETALAYEVIYQRPVRELFAGLYEEIERNIAARAKILSYRKDYKPNADTVRKREVLANLARRRPKEPINQEQT